MTCSISSARSSAFTCTPFLSAYLSAPGAQNFVSGRLTGRLRTSGFIHNKRVPMGPQPTFCSTPASPEMGRKRQRRRRYEGTAGRDSVHRSGRDVGGRVSRVHGRRLRDGDVIWDAARVLCGFGCGVVVAAGLAVGGRRGVCANAESRPAPPTR